MAISYSEAAALTCPACSQHFEAEVWTLVDAAERPDLAEALHEGTLDQVVCPHCGYQGIAGAPLLFHDPQQRRVYFAVPSGIAEYMWRERAQELHYLLVGSLPDEARRPYLGDVQVEQEVEGLRRAVLRRNRNAGRRAQAVAPAPTELREPVQATIPAPEPEPQPPQPSEQLLALISDLLAANSPQHFQMMVHQHPILLSDVADTTMAQLADLAYAEGERPVAEAIREARVVLGDLRRGEPQPVVLPAAQTRDAAATSAAPSERPSSQQPQLSDSAYQSLLRANTSATLLQTTRAYPALLEPWVDRELAARVDGVLEEGNERLAREIEERREVLAELRASISGEAHLIKAIQTLLKARDTASLEQALTSYPVLLTDAAQDALFTLAAGARARGDTPLAEYAVECRAMLRQVRADLEG